MSAMPAAGRPRAALLPLLAALALAGCASADLDGQLAAANRDAAGFTGGKLALARTDAERTRMQAEADRLLATPLDQAGAVQLALAGSPALQAALAEHWSASASAAQGGRIANPMFSFERTRLGGELEIVRTLSFGLFELLLLPARAAVAERRVAASQLQLTAEVVRQITEVRQAWVRAVAARQNLAYATQVHDSAEASAELARRMQAVGNWNRLTRARQQLFYADAATQLALARQAELATREALVRALGLDTAQAARLQLPERLPELPAQPVAPEAMAQAAPDTRLDLRLARARYDAAAAAQGLGRVGSVLDVELAGKRSTVWPEGAGRETGRGWELGVRLPLFDFGGTRRDAMNAETLAAAQRLEATRRAAESQLRESQAAYRTAWALARHYRDEVVPLRRLMQEENQLRYNAMLIGVFELLQDAREQVRSVMAAIDTQQQFWLADAALQASLIGQPTGATLGAMPDVGGYDAQAH